MNNAPGRRTKQVAQEILRSLDSILRKEVKDPRIERVGMITLSGIELADDYRNATIWVSFMGKSKDSKEVIDALKALQSSSGFLHRAIVKQLPMKMHPHFHFKYDPMFDKAAVVHKAFLELDETSSSESKSITPKLEDESE